jgi:hypothetical protein
MRTMNRDKDKATNEPAKDRMPERDFDLAHFFAWARVRAYAEFEARLARDPSLDPNWTFSDIMQELLADFHRLREEKSAAESAAPQE